jgi:hypothetical protein
MELELTQILVALYGLEVSPGDVLVPAVPDFPATVSNENFALFVSNSSFKLQHLSPMPPPLLQHINYPKLTVL